ncbi:MAG: SDR family NAD(P)-dependent oxidoreductase [Salinirussus sp.]
MSSTRRVVAVTGANAGIGLHLLRSLRDDGYRVAGLDIESDNLDPLAAERPSVRYVPCDVTDTAAVETAIDSILEEWNRIDILVNNAGIFEFAPFAEQTLTDTKREFEVNYFGYTRTLRAVLPHMRDRGSGIVHNVSSGAGLVGHPGLSGYASTKGAVEALVRSLRLELQHTDVAVTIMHPPLTDTSSARELGYPQSLLADPRTVGRNLADRIGKTDAVIYADWKTRLGLALSRLFPSLVRRGTARFVDSG